MISWENIQEECFLENIFEEEKDVYCLGLVYVSTKYYRGINTSYLVHSSDQ